MQKNSLGSPEAPATGENHRLPDPGAPATFHLRYVELSWKYIYIFGVGSARKVILASYLKFFSVYFQFLENPDKIKVHLYLPSVLFCPLCHWSQCAKNVMSDNPALEDFIIRLMDTLLCLPNRLRKVFGVNIWRNSIHGYDVFGNIRFGSQR